MQRVAGFLLILAGCSGLGLWYSMQFRLRLLNLKQMIHILHLLESQVRFGRSTLPECCDQIAKRVKNPFADSFKQIYEVSKQNDGKSFGQVCQDILSKQLKKLVADNREKDLFVECFVSCGYADEGMQIQNIIRIKQDLEGIAKELSENINARCRLAISLGTMSGLLLVIMFL